MITTHRKNGSVGSLEVLRAKFSLWTACLSPSVAADKWKRVEAAENYDDEVKLINLDLKPACNIKLDRYMVNIKYTSHYFDSR